MIWLVAVVAALLGLFGTRALRALAPRIGLVDAPDGVRKFQIRAVPLGGGIAVSFAGAVAVLLAILLLPEVMADLLDHRRRWAALAAASLVIVVVGLFDDWYELAARYKLLGQFAAVLLVTYGGEIFMNKIDFLGHQYYLAHYHLAAPVTAFWLIFAINSLNLLDGMDGLLGTVGGVVCLSFAGIAVMTGQWMAATVALATAGALLGFLRYNLPPASIYMGDSGSMLVGLIVGTLTVEANLKSHGMAILTPVSILVLPFLDTTAAVIRRKLTGRSMAAADRDHLHHVLLRRGLTVRHALAVVALAGAAAGVGAIAGVYFQNNIIAPTVSILVIITLVATGLFGNHELKLVQDKMKKSATQVLAVRSRRPATVPDEGPAPSASAVPPAQSP